MASITSLPSMMTRASPSRRGLITDTRGEVVRRSPREVDIVCFLQCAVFFRDRSDRRRVATIVTLSPLDLVRPPRGRNRTACNVGGVSRLERPALARRARALTATRFTRGLRPLLPKTDRLDHVTHSGHDDVRLVRMVGRRARLVVSGHTRPYQTRVSSHFFLVVIG